MKVDDVDERDERNVAIDNLIFRANQYLDFLIDATDTDNDRSSRFGRDGATLRTVSGDSSLGCVTAFLPGGVLFMVQSDRPEDQPGSAFMVPTFFPYVQITSIRESRFDYNSR